MATAKDPFLYTQVRQFVNDQIPFNKLLGIQVAELRDGFARLECFDVTE